MSVEKKYYKVIVRGIPRMDNNTPVIIDGKPAMNWIREAITPAEFSRDGKQERRRKYIVCELPENTLTSVADPSDPTGARRITISSPDTKPYVMALFEDQYPDAYRNIAALLLTGKHTPIIGDSTGRTTKVEGFNIVGKVCPYIIEPGKKPGELPTSFYMTEINDSGKTVRFSAKKRSRDGAVIEFFPTTIMGKVFLYGDECDAPEVFIEIARTKLLQSAERVTPLTNQVGGNNTTENSLHVENEMDEPEGHITEEKTV